MPVILLDLVMHQRIVILDLYQNIDRSPWAVFDRILTVPSKITAKWFQTEWLIVRMRAELGMNETFAVESFVYLLPRVNDINGGKI